MNDPIDARIADLFSAAQTVGVVSHIRPDGDAVGSLLGLGLALRAAGKTVQTVLTDGVPPNLRHLPGAGEVVKRLSGQVDLAVVVDCSDLPRTGGALGSREVDLVIDHHVTNLEFGKVNLVDPDEVATCAILALRMPQWGLKIDTDVATDLLTGLIADTIGFRTSNMNSQALRLAADLMDTGANLSDLYRRALVQKSYEAARYWGKGLDRLVREGGLVWTSLTLDDRRAVSYHGNDDADLVNVLSSIDGDVAVVFIEQHGGKVKVSWRSRPGIDVSNLALRFGGGGHPAAAGVEMQGDIEEVKNRVLTATRELLDGSR